MKLPTNWEGVYSYDPIPELPSTFVDTAFVLIIRMGWLGRFTGEIRDSEPGIPEPAKVKGWAASGRIRFAKTYSSFWMADKHGTLTRMPSLAPYVLHYYGYLNGDDNCRRIEGTWCIPGQKLKIEGQSFEMPKTTGTWTATSTTEDVK